MDWLVLSKDMVLLSGRELGQNVHPEVATFSVAVGREMAPAFHMVVHAQTSRGEIVSGQSGANIDKRKGEGVSKHQQLI